MDELKEHDMVKKDLRQKEDYGNHGKRNGWTMVT